MLEGGGDVFSGDGAVIGALEASDYCRAHQSAKEWVFAKGLAGTAPAGVPGDVDNGGEDHGRAARCGLCGDIGVYLLYEEGIPGAGKTDGHGEDIRLHGHEAVVGLVEKDGWDSKTSPAPYIVADGRTEPEALFQGIAEFGVDHPDALAEEGVHLMQIGEQLVADTRVGGPGAAQLCDLFFGGHSGKQVPHPFGDG